MELATIKDTAIVKTSILEKDVTNVNQALVNFLNVQVGLQKKYIHILI